MKMKMKKTKMTDAEWDDFIFKLMSKSIKFVVIGFLMMFFAAFTWLILTDGNIV